MQKFKQDLSLPGAKTYWGFPGVVFKLHNSKQLMGSVGCNKVVEKFCAQGEDRTHDLQITLSVGL